MIKPWGHLHRRVFLHLYLRMIWLTLSISSLLSFNFTHAKYHRTQKESVFWICCSYWTGTPCTWCAFWVVYRVKVCTLSDTIFTYCNLLSFAKTNALASKYLYNRGRWCPDCLLCEGGTTINRNWKFLAVTLIWKKQTKTKQQEDLNIRRNNPTETLEE